MKNSQWHHPRWQHQCSLKHFPWLCVAQMESPSHGRKSGLPAQLLAKFCASSNFSLFGHFGAPEAAITASPELYFHADSPSPKKKKDQERNTFGENNYNMTATEHRRGGRASSK